MNKIILIIAIVFSGMLMQAQSLFEIADNSLGQKSFTKKIEKRTDYGTLMFKVKTKKGKICQLTVTVPNGSKAHIEILSITDYQYKKIGSVFTDFYFIKMPFEDIEFNDMETALKTYNECKNSRIKSFQKVKLFKHIKKEKFVVTTDYLNYKYSKSWNLYYTNK